MIGESDAMAGSVRYRTVRLATLDWIEWKKERTTPEAFDQRGDTQNRRCQTLIYLVSSVFPLTMSPLYSNITEKPAAWFPRCPFYIAQVLLYSFRDTKGNLFKLVSDLTLL